MKNSKVQKMIVCALFAALTAVLSQIAIPIGPIPINLATLAVFIAGALLGSKLGALSLSVWVMLGAVGIPVFSMFRAGIANLVGPTGGFIIGYVPAAFFIGFIIDRYNKNNQIYIYLLAMLVGSLIYFSLGTIWYMIVMKQGFVESFLVCVVPFILGDLIKIILATLITHRIRPIIQKSSSIY